MLTWDNWSTLSANLHKYMASQARHPTLSHVTPPPIRVIGGQWCWPGIIGPHCLPMCISIWHLRQDVPLCPMSHTPPPLGLLVPNGAGLGQLVHIVCQCTQVYGISGKTSHFVPCHAPPPLGLLVVNGAGLGQLVHIVCQYTQVYGILGKMSHFVPCHAPPIGVIGGQWC